MYYECTRVTQNMGKVVWNCKREHGLSGCREVRTSGAGPRGTAGRCRVFGVEQSSLLRPGRMGSDGFLG